MQEALASLFGGSYRWNPATKPDPWDHLYAFASSALANLGAKRGRHQDAGESFDTRADFAPVTASDEPSAHDLIEFVELDEAIADEILSDDDPDLLSLYDLARRGDDLAPSAVAKALGIPVRSVDNLKKRLKRRTDAAIERLRARRQS